MLAPETIPPFPLKWGFSTKLDDPSTLPLPQLNQVHGCGVVEATGVLQEADGIWTTQPGVRIGVRVADCVPILLAGPLGGGKPWIAALHGGWRGATAGILRRGVQVFQELGGDVFRLSYAFGPSIQVCHFEVGKEVVEAARSDPAWHAGLRHQGHGSNPHLDLQGFLCAQAADLGMDPAKNGSVPLCTVCQENLFWSYRRGDTKARQWGWVEIMP